MRISSSVFKNNDNIPQRYTCEGERFLSPPLTFEEIPAHAKSLCLIVEDPDVPKELRPDGLFVHWVLFNIPPDTTALEEGTSTGTTGANTRGEARYTGPCPPREYEPRKHRYIFTLYALDTLLSLPGGNTKEEVLSAIETHIIETSSLIGLYEKMAQ